jgi:ABC-type multidrug transport system fused ATPase/permease subunit
MSTAASKFVFSPSTVINRIVEAGVSINRVQSFLLCDDHRPVGPGNLSETGVSMKNVSSAYDSKKPVLVGVDIDPVAKELADKNWEVSLLRSQLEDAEQKIKELTMPEGKEGSVEEIGSFSNGLLCLKRINFECKPGELIAIVGGVGCGK